MKRTPARILAPLAVGAVVFSVAGAASAAGGFKTPDVLLLIDTSGSMGLTTVRDPNASDPTKYAPPKCAAYPASSPVNLNATDFSGATPPDRWSILVSVLTGTIKGHACSTQPRNANDFIAEYGLGGTTPGANVDPYDKGYYMPFNRIVAKLGNEQCTPAPSWNSDIRTQLANNAVKWPTSTAGGPIYWRDTAQSFANMPQCSFAPQDRDGVLDSFQHSARFGLMTFDTNPHWLVNNTKSIGTGIVTSSNPPEASYPGGVGDTWSFFPNWRTNPSTGFGTGWPGGCSEQADALLEVGARNPAAPPWEGRLIGFGDPDADTDEIIRNNERVQQALSAIRPYGATPIAGMLEDARHFLLEDDTVLTDSAGNGYYWGGKFDKSAVPPAGESRCRNRFVILITDGGPNLDLRPDCAYTVGSNPGKCPYRTPEQTVQLLTNADPMIKTYVIGFALTAANGTGTCKELLQGTDPCSTTALTSCTDASCTSGQCAYGYCINTPEQETLAACCKIEAIAAVGGTDPVATTGLHARWADDAGTLRSAIQDILNENPTFGEAKTQPVFAAGNAHYDSSATQEQIAAAEFLNNFSAVPNHMDVGSLQRIRYVCDEDSNGIPVPVPKLPIDEGDGDDFSKNVDLYKTGRTVFTVVGEVATDGKIQSGRSIRPWYNESTGDGLGSVTVSTGDADTKMVGGQASSFATLVNPKALIGDDVCTTNCCFDTPDDPAPSAETCAARILNLQLALSAGDPNISNDVRASAFAPIVGAAPVLNGPPDDYLRDESYRAFQLAMANRELVLYAPTIDGQLHAFKTNHGTQELNELWTFMPPAVLPGLETQFAGLDASITRNLLDGPIVVNDVAGRLGAGSTGRFLSRTKADAQAASPTTTQWHSVLVGAFGSSPGYYAVDVSWPNSKTTAPTGYVAGPRFLWQLTTDEDGRPLFGSRSTTPTITTLFFKMPGDTAVAEHAVAILPGGYGGERSDTLVDVIFDAGDVQSVDGDLTVRGQTHLYTPSGGSENEALHLAGARSLTIVRLDTGEVVRTFRRGVEGVAPNPLDKQAPPGLYAQSRITNAPFDAPVMGRVIAYPNGPGAVSDRAYVGDAEGRLWRVDLTSAEPGDWSVALFHDAYPTAGLDLAFTAQDAAPIETPPILSTDPLGRVTVAISTGDQRTFTESGEYTVWSLTETLNGTTPTAHVNWFLAPNNAENPSGTNPPPPPDEVPADPDGGAEAGTSTYQENPPHFDNGERVTGPMVLFDSVLYFTSYAPSDKACDMGQSFLWGVHYINRKTESTAKSGPAPVLPPTAPDDGDTSADTTDPAEYVLVIPLGAGAVFGPGITAKPACYVTDDNVAADPFLGFGSHTSVTSVTPTQFQLVVQRPGGSSDAQTSVYRRNIFPPLGGGRIDSWASILE